MSRSSLLSSLLTHTRSQLLLSKLKTRTAVAQVWHAYEDLIGVREMRRMQECVLSAERSFIVASKDRRNANAQLSEVQQALRQIRQRLDSTSRTDDSYLDLVTREHQLFREESKLAKELAHKETQERDLFSHFSQNLRDYQEVERMRQERTKYLSLIGSLIGAALGIIGTSINHALKNRDFRQILRAIDSQNELLELHRPHVQSDEKEAVMSSETANCVGSARCDCKVIETAVMDKLDVVEAGLHQKMTFNAVLTAGGTYILIAVTLPLLMKMFAS